MADIRKFDDAAIQKSIDGALAQVPEDRKGAVVGYADLDGNYKLATMARLGDQWSVVMVVDKERDKPLEGAAAVRFVW